MNLVEVDQALRKLRLSGMADLFRVNHFCRSCCLN